MIDWNDPKAKVSKYFTVKECLWLPSWNRMATEADGLNDTIRNNLADLCTTMDPVREFVGAAFNVHCMYRPEAYNKQIGGALKSAHSEGKAIDYDAEGLDCDDVRAMLEPKLEEFGVRMEKMPGGKWIHNDTREVLAGHNRYFIP